MARVNMEGPSGQKIEKTELQTLIEKSHKQVNRRTWMEVGKVFILPLTLAAITWRVNVQQEQNTERLALEQIKSAEIIAKANREHSSRISESNQRIERIKHIKEVFTGIITKRHDTTEAVAMEIRSLEVYKSDALSFLLNIRAHFNHQERNGTRGNGRGLDYGEIVAQTDQTISNILQNSPIDVSGRLFFMEKAAGDGRGQTPGAVMRASAGASDGVMGTTIRQLEALIRQRHAKMSAAWEEPPRARDLLKTAELKLLSQVMDGTEQANMRKQKYHNYDFSKSVFINTALYQADFSNCTLKGTLFINVDLQEASFSESNLCGAVFINCNLKRVNFSKTRLRDTWIMDPVRERRNLSAEQAAAAASPPGKAALVCELEDAEFSLGTLLKTAHMPFNFIQDTEGALGREKIDLYVNLLVPHQERLSTMKQASDKDFRALLMALGKENYEALEAALVKEAERLERHAGTFGKTASKGAGIQMGLSL